ncbi:hypothetical protein [Mycolicibacterium sp. J2]|uniref:hypothetical protein n=1 Tax=Mycolicibacterium sp. J2 TaxID=2993511 RepID=UPI00224B5620|nr:hypothetical protein [Mycolicibacterium sp. J2]MCX2713139.1 hypothetical protein [Mycolicibacterium sp. J2]
MVRLIEEMTNSIRGNRMMPSPANWRPLAGAGRHRVAGMAGLLIATLANAHDVTLLHYVADFEIAAEVLPFHHRRAP